LTNLDPVGTERQRVAEPVDITAACNNHRHKSRQMPMVIGWKQKTASDRRKWAFTIAIVKHNGVDQLIEKMMMIGDDNHRSIADTSQSIVNRLRRIDADVEMENLRVSLRCPVSILKFIDYLILLR
jgi:hypothetical protein